jgi:hypothetical protein
MPNWADQVEDDLAWREAELASLKVQVAKSRPGSVARQAMLRSLWSMLYAHFEGFCRYAWNIYFDAIEASGAQRSDCKPKIAQMSLSKEFRRIRGDLSAENLWEFMLIGLPLLLSNKVRFETRFEESGNLWPQVVKENSASVGLPSTQVDTYEVEIRSLVARRNDIAHGKQMTINSLSEYEKYENAAFLIMHELAIAIVDCIENRTFLSP